ncbi:ATP-dependent nuclease [Piscinibacter defluvii]|uniref:ATP-dependent nuclease n=1 Tax=Piscinibacter defluvii TaxID=1796922 RepID=UPI000FDEFC93|nr:AAA family ATPase [Piscinibacter defluvii]
MIKLRSVEIENFRSIIAKPLRVTFDDLTVIVGPNNCGKSNILRALQLFFTGSVEGLPYASERDYPKSGELNKSAQTKITLTVSYEPTKEISLKRSLDELEKASDQQRLDDDQISLRLSYSKNGVESWQFLGKKGVRNIKKELIFKVRDSLLQSVIFKYIPVGRDSLESITSEISTELIRTIFSGWSGAVKKRQEINEAIATLLARLTPELQTSSDSVTGSIQKVFAEVKKLELRLPFSNLEEMLPNLTPVISDTAETGLKSKGAGIQTSSLLFLLKYLADNHPQRHNARQTFIWAVEEPESFLHPTKQKAMADMLRGFSKEVQTVITTHCGHFVPRTEAGAASYVVDKASAKPWSTEVVGQDYELARQTLGISLLDSMMLYPVNLVVEGPSDEILLQGALRQLDGKHALSPLDVKCFPASNATSATYLFESLVTFSTGDTTVKLVIDGDKAGLAALEGLLGRAKRDGIKWKANDDYFQLALDVENLLSDRVKRALHAERPAQVQLIEDVHKNIKSFRVVENKKANAARALELSDEADLGEFKLLFDRISDSLI